MVNLQMPMINRRAVILLLSIMILVPFFFETVVFASASVSGSSEDDWLMPHHEVSNAGFTTSSAPLYMPTKIWSCGDQGNIQQFPRSPII
jgi:hypothetical protein